MFASSKSHQARVGERVNTPKIAIKGVIFAGDDKEALRILESKLCNDEVDLIRKEDAEKQRSIPYVHLDYKFIVRSKKDDTATYIALFEKWKTKENHIKDLENKLKDQLHVYLWHKPFIQRHPREIIGSCLFVVTSMGVLLAAATNSRSLFYGAPTRSAYSSANENSKSVDATSGAGLGKSSSSVAMTGAAQPPTMQNHAGGLNNAGTNINSPAAARSYAFNEMPSLAKPKVVGSLEENLQNYLATELKDDAEQKGWSSVTLTLTMPIAASYAYGVGNCHIDGGLDATTSIGIRHILPSQDFKPVTSSDGNTGDELMGAACRKAVDQMIDLLHRL